MTYSVPSRRRLMMAAVATAVLMLSQPVQAEGTPSAKPGIEKAAPVSAEALAKAKVDVEQMRAMSQDERVKYIMEKRDNKDHANYEALKAEHRARAAYIASLPEAEQKALREQMKADRDIVSKKRKEKWEAMTPEERAAIKAKHKAEFEKLPPEVKEKIKAARHKRMKDKAGKAAE